MPIPTISQGIVVSEAGRKGIPPALRAFLVIVVLAALFGAAVMYAVLAPPVPQEVLDEGLEPIPAPLSAGVLESPPFTELREVPGSPEPVSEPRAFPFVLGGAQ